VTGISVAKSIPDRLKPIRQPRRLKAALEAGREHSFGRAPEGGQVGSGYSGLPVWHCRIIPITNVSLPEDIVGHWRIKLKGDKILISRS